MFEIQTHETSGEIGVEIQVSNRTGPGVRRSKRPQLEFIMSRYIISDPLPNKVVESVENWCQKSAKISWSQKGLFKHSII